MFSELNIDNNFLKNLIIFIFSILNIYIKKNLFF